MDVSNDESIRNRVANQVWNQPSATIELDKSKAKDNTAKTILVEAGEHALLEVATTVGEHFLPAAAGAFGAIASPALVFLSMAEAVHDADEKGNEDAKAYISMRYEVDMMKYLSADGGQGANLLTNQKVIDEQSAFFKSQGYDPALASKEDVKAMEYPVDKPELQKTDLQTQIHFLKGERDYLQAMNETDPAKKKAMLSTIEQSSAQDYPYRLGMMQASAMGGELSLDKINKQLSARFDALNKLP